MTITLFTALGTTVAACWSVIAVGVSVVIGRSIRMAEERERVGRRLEAVD